MRSVCQILPALDSGGVERGTLEIANALQKAGMPNLVVSSGGKLVAELEKAGVKHVTLPVHSKNPFVMFLTALKLRKVFKDENVGVVHVRSRAPAWTAKIALKPFKNIAFLATYHGTYGIKPAWIKKPYNRVMLSGDLVIAVSKHIANHIKENYGVPDEKIRLVCRGAETDLFDPAKVSEAERRALAEKWGIDASKTILMLPGRLTRIKGHHLVMDALAQMRHKDDVQCLFVGGDQGKTEYTDELKAEIEKRGLTGKVLLTGGCSQMPAAYMLADIVISATTKPEAFGRTIPEAQLMGALVVGANYGGAAETIEHNVTGMHFKPSDAADLAEKLDAMIDLPDAEKQKMREAAAAFVRKNFTIQLLCDKTLGIYQELLTKYEAK